MRKNNHFNNIDFNSAQRKASNLDGQMRNFVNMIDMAKDIAMGRYSADWKTIALLISTITYVILPTDASPDFLPFVGWIDDIGMVAATAAKIHAEMTTYLHSRRR